jgi:hypothetical protein
VNYKNRLAFRWELDIFHPYVETDPKKLEKFFESTFSSMLPINDMQRILDEYQNWRKKWYDAPF